MGPRKLAFVSLIAGPAGLFAGVACLPWGRGKGGLVGKAESCKSLGFLKLPLCCTLTLAF